MLAELKDVVRALENDQLVPYFQPIVEVRTGLVKGFEVLARWLHPLHGPILPSNLILLAEENGLIDVLTRQVMRRALQVTSSLPPSMTLSLNVSPTQLHSFSLPSEIRGLAEEASFPMDGLIVEITESALLTDLERAKKIAGSLKDMGCKLALDDFGTGYSSLGHLQGLPFDQLKIDRSFVSEMSANRHSRKIVAAIVGLA
jgi:EAL domain-containing protein (putative c-di-GMP-specific phosphodiesterase class I)